MKKQVSAIVRAGMVAVLVWGISNNSSSANAENSDMFRVADVQLTGLVLPGYCTQQPACVLQLNIPQTLPNWQIYPEYRIFLQSPVDNNAAFEWCMSRLIGECVGTGTSNQTPTFYTVQLPTNKHPVDALIVNEYMVEFTGDCPT